MYQGSFLELTDATAAAIAIVDVNGDQLPGVGAIPVTFTAPRPATATLTSVSSTAVSVTILASNAARYQFIVHNLSSKILYLAFAATASATAFTVEIAANAEYESVLNSYTGVISGIWSAVNGSAKVTEITT